MDAFWILGGKNKIFWRIVNPKTDKKIRFAVHCDAQTHNVLKLGDTFSLAWNSGGAREVSNSEEGLGLLV
jgi:hypothetical protein